ncbi:MAG: 16S rRNA (guanine(966)-N(2))-methyltransferase RsmD [Eubacteriaceae bacterium]|nr:16S rRNA (guanine(966)-N(2))-methyltransferase RsmD [Eubacteriaceae bacterium]MBR5995214.1 16S rRNA (guanine(966)-N(2))-methyltransferase RsmD [Eubacteriaceae bacterium]
MRVIAGLFRGMTIISPKGNDIRPTTDRVKEDIFNIIRPNIAEDTVFLDLFCGTGAIGIEAVSRGAGTAYLVDSSKEAIALAAKNVEKTKMSDHFVLKRSEAASFLSSTRARFDIIFMDPPYEFGGTDALAGAIRERGLLKEGGLLLIELSSRSNHDTPPGYELIREKVYSATRVGFYKLLANEGEEQ